MATEAGETRTATAYEALGIDPCAPVDLISSSYWNLVKELQAFRGHDPRIETMLYHAMRAYETLSDTEARKEYDESIGQSKEPLTRRKFQRAKKSGLGFLPGRNKLQITADPYEVMGLHPTTLQSSVPDAYRIMKQQYLRLPPTSRRRAELLRLLDESYAVLSDPEKRAIYDEGTAKAAAEPVAAAEPAAIEPVIIEHEVAASAPTVDEAAPVPAADDIATPAPPVEIPPEWQPTATEESAAVAPNMQQTRYVVKETAPESMAPESTVPEPPAPEPEEPPEPPAPATVPDPAPSRAGRLRRTTKVKAEATEATDDLVPPPPPAPRGPRRRTVEGDVEAVMLGRLEERMQELAAYGGSSEPPGDDE